LINTNHTTTKDLKKKIGDSKKNPNTNKNKTLQIKIGEKMKLYIHYQNNSSLEEENPHNI